MDLVNFISKRFSSLECNKTELKGLKRRIVGFKWTAVQWFENYQASRLKTQNWHFLDHVVAPIGKACGAVYLHTGLYESDNKHFKITWDKTSKQASTAMAQVVIEKNKIT